MSPFLPFRGLPAVYGGPKGREDPFGQRAPGDFDVPNHPKSFLRDGPRHRMSTEQPNLQAVEGRFDVKSLTKPRSPADCNRRSCLQLNCSSRLLASPTYFQGVSYRPAGSQMTSRLAQMHELEVNGRRPLARTPPSPAKPSSPKYPSLIRSAPNTIDGKPQMHTSLYFPSSNRFMKPLHTSSIDCPGAEAAENPELRMSNSTTKSLEYDSSSETGDDSDEDDISFNDAMTAVSHFSIMLSQPDDQTDLPSSPDVWPSAPSSQSSSPTVDSASASSAMTVSREKSSRAELELHRSFWDSRDGAHSRRPQQSSGGIGTIVNHMDQPAANRQRALSIGSASRSTYDSHGEDDDKATPMTAQRPCSPEVRIPGRYMSICELDRVAAQQAFEGPGTLSFNSLPPTENHAHAQGTQPGLAVSFSSPGMVFPELARLLNQWEKAPSNQEIPRSFIKKLKEVLDGYVLPKQSDSVAYFQDKTYRMPSNNQVPWPENSCGAQDPSIVPDCRDSELDWNAEVGKTSRVHNKSTPKPVENWTPFSERSRVPASRQLIPTGKSSHYSQHSNSPSSQSLNQKDVLPNISLPLPPMLDDDCKSVDSIKLSGQHAHRRKNLQAFFGSGFSREADQPDCTTYETVTSSKPRERRERKTSLAVELSKTVRGFRLAKLQSRPWTGDSVKSSRTNGFLSDGGEDPERSLGPKFQKHQRHLSSASSIDKGDSWAPSLDDTSAGSSSKKSRGVRFE